jgi:uncharacterized membrane protein
MNGKMWVAFILSLLGIAGFLYAAWRRDGRQLTGGQRDALWIAFLTIVIFIAIAIVAAATLGWWLP